MLYNQAQNIPKIRLLFFFLVYDACINLIETIKKGHNIRDFSTNFKFFQENIVFGWNLLSFMVSGVRH